MNDNTKGVHVPRQGVDHLPGQLDLIEHAKLGAPAVTIQEYTGSLEHEHKSSTGGRCDTCFEKLPDNVVLLGGVTSHDLPVNRILQAAHDADLETVLILGYKKDGSEYFAASTADGAENIWLMERAKHNMMKICDGDYETPTHPEKA